jgi:DNA-binding transcriptional ArsR family regulator
MKKISPSHYKARAKIMKALAHPTRLFIIDMLADGEKCVCELNRMIDADGSTVSKHLAVLRDSGLVDDEKRGLNVYYRLKCPCALNFMTCVEDVIKSNLDDQVNLTGWKP